MSGKGFRLTWLPTTSGGTVSRIMTDTYWPQIVNGSCQLNHIYITASLGAGIKFDFKITSPSGNVILRYKNISGELNESPNIIMRGQYTLTIENCSPDDTFSCEFMFENKKEK